MGFFNAGPVMGVLDMYRMIWISGRFGGHKTALAYKIAEPFLKKGYYLATNNKTVWADDLDKIQLNEKNQLHCVCILDEGGLYFKSGRQVEQIAAYAAKMDIVYIIPSFWPPTAAAQILNIQPVVSLKATGLPVIIYKWTVKIGQFKERGWFFWWYPQEIYGIYSRQDPGEDPEKIVKFLIDRANQFRSRYGHDSNQIFSLGELSEGDKILEASEVLQGAFSDLEALPGGRGRKRR